MRIEIIDFLKGYSISTIVLMHLLGNFDFPKILENAISFGGSGVHVFILVSGFGLGLSQLTRPLNYFDFLKRRFLKVYFPYILIISISALTPFMFDGDRFTAFLSHVFFFKMFNEELISSFGLQFWFLSMIFCLYAVFPILFRVITFGKWKAILFLFVSSLIYSTVVICLEKSQLRIWNSFFIQYLGEFSLGIILSIYFKKNSKFLRIPSKIILLLAAIIGIVITGLLANNSGPLKLFNDIPSLIGYLSLALLIYSLNIPWLNLFFNFTNRHSYEWYLIHILIFTTIFRLTGTNFMTAITAFTCSYILAIFYKKISMKLFAKFIL